MASTGRVRRPSPIYTPLGGTSWLIVIAFGMLVGLVSLVVGLFSQIGSLLQLGSLLTPGHPYHSLWWAPLVLAETLCMLAWLAALCWLLVLFFTRRATFPRLWVRVGALGATFLTLDAVALLAMSQRFPNLWTVQEIATEFRMALWNWAAFWIWKSYLEKSRRVRNTFVVSNKDGKVLCKAP